MSDIRMNVILTDIFLNEHKETFMFPIRYIPKDLDKFETNEAIKSHIDALRKGITYFEFESGNRYHRGNILRYKLDLDNRWRKA